MEITKEILEKLAEPMDYQWRVQSFSKSKAQASCVAYIDARDVEDRLDKVVGPNNWKDDYKIVGNKFMAGIAININGDWVFKWDTGIESKVEKEKGEVSDAFKRAAVKWGIGRFLYNLNVQYVDANEVKTNNNYPYVVDENGNRVWDLTEFINNRKSKKTRTITPVKTEVQQTQATQPVSTTTPEKKDFTPKPKVGACESCGAEITEKVKEYSEKHFNKALCFNCQKEQKK